MNKLTFKLFKAARCLYLRKRRVDVIPSSNITWDPHYASSLISPLLQSSNPCMIARFGSIEMAVIANYQLKKEGKSGYLSFIQGKTPLQDNWNQQLITPLCNNAGFFPKVATDSALLAEFCELMLDCIPELDILGSWLSYEQMFDHMHHAKKIHLLNLEPFMGMDEPWSQHLAGKKVLVVHPFVKSIQSQYENKRELLFSSPKVLPQFELKLIKAVQSIAGSHPPEFKTWFDALNHMKAQIDASDYDVCLLGCGAYGFPLAAHIKKQGKQAIHMGGSLQLLFGIKGKRWVEQYGDDAGYNKIFNEHWIFPDESETPQGASKVEGACYW